MHHFLPHLLVISAADHEAHYVIDGLMHNDVVKSAIHSTDTGGYSDILFGTMHLLGFSFAPRIKNFGKSKLVAFQKRKYYQEQGLPEPSPLVTIRNFCTVKRSSKRLRKVAVV